MTEMHQDSLMGKAGTHAVEVPGQRGLAADLQHPREMVEALEALEA